MVRLGKIVEMPGIQADAGPGRRISDFPFPPGIVNVQMPVAAEIIAEPLAALVHVALQGSDPCSAPQPLLADEPDQPAASLDE